MKNFKLLTAFMLLLAFGMLFAGCSFRVGADGGYPYGVRSYYGGCSSCGYGCGGGYYTPVLNCCNNDNW